MIDTIRLVDLIKSFGEMCGCCEYCPAYEECYQGADCEQVIYNWLNKENRNDC